MKRVIHYFMLVVLVLLFTGSFASCSKDNSSPKYKNYKQVPGVTQKEIESIEALKTKYGSFSYGHLIITESFENEDNVYAGFTIEVCKLLSELFQTQFNPKVYDEWSDLKGDIDSCVTNFSGEFTQTAERMHTYEMTTPIAGRGLNAYTLAGSAEITADEDLNGKKVGFLSGAVAADLIVERYPESHFEAIEIPGFSDAVDMLLSGGIDAFVTDNVVDTMFDQYDFIRSTGVFQFVYAPVSITTKDAELKPFISVINKYLDAGGIDTVSELYRKGNHEYKKLKLYQSFTDAEKAYLNNLKQQNSVVNIALMHDAYPASFYNKVEKRYDGAAYQILNEVSALTDITFNPDCMPIEKPLSDILAKLKSGEISMMPQLLYSESRKDDYIWSNTSYITTNFALLSKSDYPDLQPFQVYYARVGTVNKSVHEEVFKTFFPDHEKTIVYQTGDEGFNALENGEIDVLMLAESMLLVQTNYREKLGYKVNMRFSKKLDTLYGFNKDEVVLRDIFDKSLMYIDVKGIEESWITRAFDYESKMLRDMMPYMIGFSAVLLVALFVVFILLIKNHRINKNLELIVSDRTKKMQQATEAAEHASKAKGDFLSRMSHEIRTPLNAIIGMNDIAMNTDDLAKIHHCHDRVGNASKHLLGLINDILDMSKIEADKFELSSGEFDFENMLVSITNVVNHRAEEKHQNLVVNLGQANSVLLIGDELRLSQVITNLLSNAVKFTPENGTIVLGIEKAGETDDDITLKFTVADNGIGISEEQQKRLFNSFEQADGSISRKFGGTGLGLSISKHIVELMGGKIWVESEIGCGSKFIFTIKAKKGKKKSYTGLSQKINKDIRILAVDDSEEVRQCILRIMQAHGLPCDTASDGESALEKIRRSGDKPYNICFVDGQMPDMDGIELTKRIKALTGDSAVIFMISMVEWNAVEKEAVKAGVRRFVPKPLFPSSLIDAVNECLGVESVKEGIRSDINQVSLDFRNHTILIAEDVAINQEIISAVLENTGISVDFADNGQAAVSMFQEHPDKYDLILMDIQMPEMDGYEATRTIRSTELTKAKSIPIIAMTANVFKEDVEKCLDAGMNDHLGKPIDHDAIFAKLSHYLTKGKE